MNQQPNQTGYRREAARIVLIAILCLPIMIWFENCSAPGSPNNPDPNSFTDGVILPTSPGGLTSTQLQLEPLSQQMLPGTVLQFYAVGGTPPYSFAVASGGGAINSSTGLFAAPADNEIITVEAMDSGGQISTSTVTTNSTLIPALNPVGEAQVYQFYNPYNNTHFFTLSMAEGAADGYEFQQNAFIVVVSSSVSGVIPLYRCILSATGGTFLSTDSGCEGQTMNTSFGYIYSAYQNQLTTPLYRFFNAATTDYFETTDQGTAEAMGYTFVGVLGYVPTQ